jgi:hypothetical protein
VLRAESHAGPGSGARLACTNPTAKAKGQWRGFTWNISRDPSARIGRLASTVDPEGGGRRGPSGRAEVQAVAGVAGWVPRGEPGSGERPGSGGWHARSACEGGREPTRGGSGEVHVEHLEGEPAARRGQLASAVDLEGGGRRGPKRGACRGTGGRRCCGLVPPWGRGAGDGRGGSGGWHAKGASGKGAHQVQ